MASTKEQKAELIEAAFQVMGCHYERINMEKNDELILFRFGDNGAHYFTYVSVFEDSVFARAVFNSGAMEEDKITKGEFHEMVRIYEPIYGTIFESDDVVAESETASGAYVLALDTQLWLPQFDEEIGKNYRYRKTAESVVTTLLAVKLCSLTRKLVNGRSAITTTRDRVTGEIIDDYITREHLQTTAITIMSIDDGVLTTNYNVTDTTWIVSGKSYLMPITLFTFDKRCKFSGRGITDHETNIKRIRELMPDFDGDVDYCILNEEDDLAIVQATYNSSSEASQLKDDPDMVKHAYYLRLTPHNYLDSIDRVFAAVGAIIRGLRLIELNVNKHITEETSKWRTGTLRTDHFTVDAVTTARPS